MTTFYFVRHAHANWIPDENRPLSESGLSKTPFVADILQQHPITTIYASPYRRANQTVELLAQRLKLPVHTEDDLRERQLAGGPVDDFDQAIEAVWRNPTFAHPGGESNEEAKQRGVALIQRLGEHHPDGHIVLGTHGNLMALTLQHFDPNVDHAFWKSLTMPDIYRLTIAETPVLARLWEKSAQ